MGNRMVLGENQYYSLDTYKTGLNNNVLVVGASGAGKTTGVVIPNILEASGNYVVSDPKGSLYKRLRPFLKKKGYKVKKLDFTKPIESVHYNFFNYIKNEQDIIKIAHMIISSQHQKSMADPFWDRASELLLQSLIAYLWETCDIEAQNLKGLLTLIDLMCIDGDFEEKQCSLDIIMNNHLKLHPESFAANQYRKFRVAADKTLRSIIISLNSIMALFDTKEVEEMTSFDDIHFENWENEKNALFVTVSDTDRSMDSLANLFFTQAMNELCRIADTKEGNNELSVPVRFILDDFATNVIIGDFPRMISSIRSRGISAMLLIQSEAQLRNYYGEDADTIICNCDSYLYLGGNDVDTAKSVAERCDLPMKKVLNMPVGTNWLFRRGHAPINGTNIKPMALGNAWEER